jgi:hypothetical protein
LLSLASLVSRSMYICWSWIIFYCLARHS